MHGRRTCSSCSEHGCAVPSLQEAAKVDRAHSERNAHRLFNRYGLALKVPISYLDFKAQEGEDNVSIPYLKVPDFLKLLLAKYEQLLLGGLPIGEASEELCNSFWERFKVYQPSHLVFEQFTASQRRKCVHGLFLPRCCAKTQLDSGFAFLRGYAWLASYCTENKISGYRLRPKLH